MKGAREYAQLFETGQDGRFYIVSGKHARGLTFRIQILPAGEKAISNGPNNLCLNKDAVEVYGVIGGHRGWTEPYGWIYRGAWEKDFMKLVDGARLAQASDKAEKTAVADRKAEKEKERTGALLDAY